MTASSRKRRWTLRRRIHSGALAGALLQRGWQQLNVTSISTVDEAMCIAEGVSAVMCAVAIPLEVIKDIPFCEWAYGAWVAACKALRPCCLRKTRRNTFYGDALVGKS